MDKRKRNYIILAVINALFAFALRMAKMLEIPIESDLANTALTLIYCTPIVALILYASYDMRLKEGWRILLRILGIFIALANLSGIIVYWFR